MSNHSELTRRLQQTFEPVVLDVVNESFMHNVPPGSESHFKVVIVSPVFEGMRKVQRHQKVYAQVNDLLAGSLHALALHTYTAAEWQQQSAAPTSPNCRGGDNTAGTPVK